MVAGKVCKLYLAGYPNRIGEVDVSGEKNQWRWLKDLVLGPVKNEVDERLMYDVC